MERTTGQQEASHPALAWHGTGGPVTRAPQHKPRLPRGPRGPQGLDIWVVPSQAYPRLSPLPGAAPRFLMPLEVLCSVCALYPCSGRPTAHSGDISQDGATGRGPTGPDPEPGRSPTSRDPPPPLPVCQSGLSFPAALRAPADPGTRPADAGGWEGVKRGLGPTLPFSCCSSIWMSVSLARRSSLAAWRAARSSALSPLPRAPMPFLDMVRAAPGVPGVGRASGLGCSHQARAGRASQWLWLRYISSLAWRENTASEQTGLPRPRVKLGPHAAGEGRAKAGVQTACRAPSPRPQRPSALVGSCDGATHTAGARAGRSRSARRVFFLPLRNERLGTNFEVQFHTWVCGPRGNGGCEPGASWTMGWRPGPPDPSRGHGNFAPGGRAPLP